MKRFSLLFLVLALAVACSPKTTPAGKSGKAASDIVILYDNDVHCSVGGYAQMAALKADKLKHTPYVTLVSNGDFVQGGSLGAVAVNDAVRAVLPDLLKKFNIIHLCGEGKLDESLQGTPGYVQYTYIKDELPDLFALADLVISRAGANAICEICALAKPNLLIPLSAKASRGDQILNARSFEKQGFSKVLEEEELNNELLLDTVNELFENRAAYTQAMKESSMKDSIGAVITVIQEAEKGGRQSSHNPGQHSH